MPVDDFTIRAIGIGALLPATVGAVVAVAAAGLGRRRSWAVALGGPVGLAAGIWAGCFALAPEAFTLPRTGWMWLPHLAVLALPAGWVAARSRRRLIVLPVGVVTAFIAVAAIVPKWPPPTRESVAWTLALGECALVVAVVIMDVVPLLPKSAVVAAMILIMTAVSLVLFAGGNARFAQTTGVVAATLGGAALVTAFLRQDVGEVIVRGLVPGFAVTLVGLTLSGYYNSYETKLNSCYPLLALAPLALAVVLIPGVRRRGVWLRVAVALGALFFPLAVAVGRAALAYTEG